MPISTVRLATEPYMVIIAPIIAPVLKITVMKIPRMRIKVAIISDCSSKNFFSLLGAKYCKPIVALEGGQHRGKVIGVFKPRGHRREGGAFESVGDLV